MFIDQARNLRLNEDKQSVHYNGFIVPPRPALLRYMPTYISTLVYLQ